MVKLNREGWLTELGLAIVPLIEDKSGKPVPKFRISVGFPSKRGTSVKRRVVGQCWAGFASADGTFEVLVSPTQDEPLDIAGTIAHELVHATVGNDQGHRRPFIRVAKSIGLVGKPTHMGAGGDFFNGYVDPIIATLGPYPHAALDPSAGGIKVQTTYMRKVYCHCGYTVRVTQKWLEKGVPECPLGHGKMKVQHGKKK